QDAHRDGIRLAAHGTPEDALAGDRLVEESAEQVVAEVRVGVANVPEIRTGKQMEDEPVVALAEDLHRDASWLLCDQQGAEVVLPTLLDPSDIRLRCRRALV